MPPVGTPSYSPSNGAPAVIALSATDRGNHAYSGARTASLSGIRCSTF